MARYHGRKGRVMLSTSGSDEAVAVIGLNAWSLSMATDKVEVTAFGDPNKVFVQGLPEVSGELSGFFDDTEDRLYLASRSADAVKMYLYPSEDCLTKYFYGTAWVDFSINTGVSEAVQISGSFSAAGAWGAQ